MGCHLCAREKAREELDWIWAAHHLHIKPDHDHPGWVGYRAPQPGKPPSPGHWCCEAMELAMKKVPCWGEKRKGRTKKAPRRKNTIKNWLEYVDFLIAAEWRCAGWSINKTGDYGLLTRPESVPGRRRLNHPPRVSLESHIKDEYLEASHSFSGRQEILRRMSVGSRRRNPKRSAPGMKARRAIEKGRPFFTPERSLSASPSNRALRVFLWKDTPCRTHQKFNLILRKIPYYTYQELESLKDDLIKITRRVRALEPWCRNLLLDHIQAEFDQRE